ncbi:MAG TPA: hypothetical protein VM534_07745, partial [Thermoanaerobaculia bacterium]|nr:hypothetical protein [Thermoanaerobaculia bacterium]
ISAVALPSVAAVRYEFEQVTRYDSALTPPARFIGRAVIDGNRSRVDYLDGSTAGNGKYVLSTSTSAVLYLVDPASKSYIETDQSGATASTANRLDIKISNFKSGMEDLGASEPIAGHPTHRYRLTTTYNITIRVGGLALGKNVRTVVEKWTTPAFPEIEAMMLDDVMVTGNQNLDRLIQEETSKIPGFPLRQVISVETRTDDRRLRQSSVLQFNQTRTQQTEMIVRRIERTSVPSAMFELPAGFRRQEARGKEEKPQIHILHLEE